MCIVFFLAEYSISIPNLSEILPFPKISNESKIKRSVIFYCTSCKLMIKLDGEDSMFVGSKTNLVSIIVHIRDGLA